MDCGGAGVIGSGTRRVSKTSVVWISEVGSDQPACSGSAARFPGEDSVHSHFFDFQEAHVLVSFSLCSCGSFFLYLREHHFPIYLERCVASNHYSRMRTGAARLLSIQSMVSCTNCSARSEISARL